MPTLASDAAFWVVLISTLCIVYLLPTLVGVIRRVDQLALVIVVNLLGGLTLFGWLAAMFLAFGPRWPPSEPPSRWPRYPHEG